MKTTDQTNKIGNNQFAAKPSVIKLFRRRRFKRNRCQCIPIIDHTRLNGTIHTSVGFPSRTDSISNPTKSVMFDHLIERTNNRSHSISVIKVSRYHLSHSEDEMENENEKNNLDEKSKKSSKDSTIQTKVKEIKHDKNISVTKIAPYQNIAYDTTRMNTRTDLLMTSELSSQMKSSKEFNEKFKKKNMKRQTILKNFCRCSRLCIFASITACILIAAAIAAGLIAILSISNTTTVSMTIITTSINNTTTTTDTTSTTDTTTTNTETTTTITYAPTGIYALKISTCATWSQTGITVAGNANGTAGGDIGSLNASVSIFIDNNYTLYVCDRDNHRIMKYVVNATPVIAAGNGTAGNSSTQLKQPRGVAIDQMDGIVIADGTNYRIQYFPSGSIAATTIAANSSSNLMGDIRDLHIDVNNAIYVTDSDYSGVVKFDSSNYASGVVLAGSSGIGSAADQFSSPYGNFIDENQTLYVADFGNNRVQKWIAGATSGTTVAGITGSSGSNLTQLNKPRAVVVDNNGYIYIVDSANNRIVRWTDNYTAGGTCIVGCTGSGGSAANQLLNPRDLKFDASGNLYVSELGNSRVQKFMLQTNNCTSSGQ